MTPPLALGLYTVRRELARDFDAVLERVAAIGYAGVELVYGFGDGIPPFDDVPAGELRRRLADLELAIASAFVPVPAGEAGERVLDYQEELGNGVLVAGFGPEAFTTADEVRRAAERFNQAAEVVRARGMRLGYHNHWWEFTASDAVPDPMAEFVAHLDPGVFLEVDVYWMQTAGRAPVETLRQLGRRVQRLHVKDGSCTTKDPQVAVGAGEVDVAAVLAAAPHVEWHVVELDEHDGDMLEAVEASHRFLTGLGQA